MHISILLVCLYTMCVPGTCGSQKGAPDLLELELTDSCELPCGCLELNPGPLEEQPMLFTTEPSPQPTPSVLH